MRLWRWCRATEMPAASVVNCEMSSIETLLPLDEFTERYTVPMAESIRAHHCATTLSGCAPRLEGGETSIDEFNEIASQMRIRFGGGFDMLELTAIVTSEDAEIASHAMLPAELAERAAMYGMTAD